MCKETKEKFNSVKCVRCNSTDLTKRGFEKGTNEQLFNCKQCGRTFTEKASATMDLIIESWIPSHRCICGSMGRMTLSHFKRDEFKILCEVCNHEIVLNYDLVTNYNSVSVDDDNDNVSTKYDCKIETQMIDSIDPFEIKDMDLYAETKRLSKSRQYQMDRNRIERKYWRNETRNNIWEEKLTENLINLLQKFDLSVNNNTIQTIKNKNQKCSAIIQVSDVHFNEIVDSVYGNSYNFEVASKRFKLFAEKSIKILNTYGVTDVVIAFCGDLMNNNKIEDKKLSQFYNRTTAMVVGCHLIESFIIDIATHFNVKVASVCGNESRIDDVGAIGFTNKIITDNFDYIIHNVLKILFRNVKNVKFVGGRFDEKILKILNRNILMTHGHTISAKDYSQNVQSLFAKHSAQGINIDFVLSGHIHNCHISDFVSRSSSMVGSNNYSNNGLNLYGKASQNIHIVHESGSIDSMKIDLQNVDDIIGYPLDTHTINSITPNKVQRDDLIIEL